MLILERPWTRQPPAGTPVINVRNRFLTIGNAADLGLESPSKKPLIRSVNGSINTTKEGVALCSTAGVSEVWVKNQYITPLLTPFPGNTGTAWCLAYCNNPSTSAKVALQLMTNDSRSVMEINFGDGTSDQIGAKFVTSGPTTVTYYSGIVPTAGTIYEIFAARRGATFVLYVDRVRCTTTPSYSTAASWGSVWKIAVASRAAAGASSLDGGVLAWAGSDQYIEAGEIPSRWSLFAPQQIKIPTAVAATTAPTITALSAINITATSAQPRISYS